MKVDSKLLLGLVVGAAVGAAVGYLATSDRREHLLEELNGVANKLKDGFDAAVSKYKQEKETLASKTEVLAPEE
jgi:gas vesicle protein